MKLAPFILGVISAQGSGDYDTDYSPVVADTADEGDRHDGYYGGHQPGYGSHSHGYDNHHHHDSYGFNYGHGRATDLKATAVTCWESNNMGSHETHHQHMYDETDQYGWANTHHGHETSKGTVNVVHNLEFVSSNGINDHHSGLAFDHRLSGCIYEIAGWDYNANTYNRVHTMTYGDSNANNVGYDSTHSNIFPVWWHYFNAHVIAGGSTHQHKLVMANPTYEGLGYLNFIVTFLLGDGANGDSERDPQTNDHNLDDEYHTDLYSNGDSFVLSFNDDAGQCADYSNIGPGNGDTCFNSKYVQNDPAVASDDWTFIQFGISSFPHNDLGKDFRFNLRMLHHLGEGDSFEFYDSYYFYRVNTITITFPYTVSCPYEQQWDGSNGAAIIHKCMDSAGHNGHQMWHSTGHSPNVDTVSPMFVETLVDALTEIGKFTQICLDTPTLEYHKCGNVYTVNGLMNMYDEHAQQEYGTHQEIWFQFYYKYPHTINDSARDLGTMSEDITAIYNYPNKLFNAFEIETITASCDNTNVFTKNKCFGGANDGVSEEAWSNNVQNPN
jgi:hypothetical protein